MGASNTSVHGSSSQPPVDAEVSQRPQPADEASRSATLVVEGAAKAFGPTQALVNCDLRLERGEIHALVGENGSGKSTLIKLLSGVFAPDRGVISWRGKPVAFTRPGQARALGIATVFQEVLVAEEASLRDNVFAGVDGLVLRGLRRSEEEATARAVLDELGLGAINLDTVSGRLSLGQKQLVTVARSVVRSCELLILDEPTSSLDVEDRERLFAFVRRLVADNGASVLFVSHRSDEIQRLADRVTVLRTGTSVASFKGASTPAHLAELMSGRRAGDTPSAQEVGRDIPTVAAGTPIRMRAKGVVLVHGRRPFSLEVRDGEILGLAGLEGHGQVAFLEAVAGLRKLASGSVAVARNGDLARVRGLEDGFKKGVAYVPRDRKTEGIFAPLAVLDNVALPSLTRYSRFGVLARGRLARATQHELDAVKLQGGTIRTTISSLSGGNQQKVLLARALATNPKLLLLNDPTRGVDLGVKAELYRIFTALAHDGMAILFLSTEVEELCELCPRIAVFHEQTCHAVLEGHMRPPDVVAAMFGGGAE